MVFESFSSSSKLASLEMQARCRTASWPSSASASLSRVADVALDDPQLRIVRQPAAEIKLVIDCDVDSLLQAAAA